MNLTPWLGALGQRAEDPDCYGGSVVSDVDTCIVAVLLAELTHNLSLFVNKSYKL
jgi:hypothetical protein